MIFLLILAWIAIVLFVVRFFAVSARDDVFDGRVEELTEDERMTPLAEFVPLHSTSVDQESQLDHG